MIRNFFCCFQSVTLKQWSMPFCAFFTTFTVVMTMLVLSTDFKSHRYIHFNSTILWEFEKLTQESPLLLHKIRKDYIKPPIADPNATKLQLNQKPSPVLLSVFKNKKGGVYFECGAGFPSDTVWLEKFHNWRGLLTQPYPDEYYRLATAGRKRSHTAQACISPTVFPMHAFFKNSSEASNETVTAIPCFPLYSLMRAYNVTDLDLLILNDVSAHIQILKTLPLRKITIKTIGFVLRASEDEGKEEEDPCCSDIVAELLNDWGYERITSCPTPVLSCYFLCKSPTNCPSPKPRT